MHRRPFKPAKDYFLPLSGKGLYMILKRTSCLFFIGFTICWMTSNLAAQVTTINGVAVPADFPVIRTAVHGQTAPGRIFFASTFFDTDWRSNYIVICENDGTPYFYRRYSRANLGSGIFKTHPNGLLSFYKYLNSDDGFYILLDHHFNEVDTLRCVGNYRTDSHELVLLPNGHALLVCEQDRTIDMSKLVTGGNKNATVVGNHFQEVDSDGNKYWEWLCWDHLRPQDAIAVDVRSSYIDYVHLNSIAVDYDGQYVLSFRSMSEVAKINSASGEFIWRLGGVHNQFTFVNDQGISAQHHAMPVPGKPDHYTIYDNNHTRAVEYQLNVAQKTAQKVWEYHYPKASGTYMMGSVQRLANENTYIDWSTTPPLKGCEVDKDNDLVFEIQVDGVSSYRSYRYEWDGMMERPYLLTEDHPQGTVLIFNKFGDRNVKEYQIYGGKSPALLDLMKTTSETYAIMTDLDNNSLYYFKTRAIGRDGQISDFSEPVEVVIKHSIPGENMLLNSDFDGGTTGWILNTQEGAVANGAVKAGEYQVSIDDGGSNYWDVQLIQEHVPLVKGRTYLFEFDAYAGSNRVIEPRVAQSGGSYTLYSKTVPIAVTRQKKRYSFTFEMTDETDLQARVVLNCGASNSTCYFDNVIVAETAESHADSQTNVQPAAFALQQNYPNPFNAQTAIRYAVARPSMVNISIYDLLGQRVREVVNRRHDTGYYTVDVAADNMASGIYFYRMTARSVDDDGSYEATRKWILVK